jgi:hypothetical protein
MVVFAAGLWLVSVRQKGPIEAPSAAVSTTRALEAEVLGATQTTVQPQENRVGSLPDAARIPVVTTTPTLPSAALGALPAWRLSSPVSYASGAIKATPVPRSVQPIRRKGMVTAIATKLAAQQFGGSLRPSDIDTFFAEFDAPVGEWLGKVGSVETEPRAVWFVVFTGMESKRSSGVVIRKRDQTSSNPPTTLSLDVTSDVVVVIDDDTGEVLVASEFLSEAVTRSAR